MTQNFKPYTYLQTRKSDGMKYYGMRTANQCEPEDDFGKVYFTSGAFEEEFRQNPENFEWVLYIADGKCWRESAFNASLAEHVYHHTHRVRQSSGYVNGVNAPHPYDGSALFGELAEVIHEGRRKGGAKNVESGQISALGKIQGAKNVESGHISALGKIYGPIQAEKLNNDPQGYIQKVKCWCAGGLSRTQANTRWRKEHPKQKKPSSLGKAAKAPAAQQLA